MGEPVQVFSLAEYIGEEMDARDWTSEDVAARMSGDFAQNALIVDMLLAVQGEPDQAVIVNAELCDPLEDAFGVSRGFFLRLNDGWDKHPDLRSRYVAPEHLFSRGRFVPTPNGGSNAGD